MLKKIFRKNTVSRNQTWKFSYSCIFHFRFHNKVDKWDSESTARGCCIRQVW